MLSRLRLRSLAVLSPVRFTPRLTFGFLNRTVTNGSVMSIATKVPVVNNRINAPTLSQRTPPAPLNEPVQYISFYRYMQLPESTLVSLRNTLLSVWGQQCGVRGRIYIASEGYNCQLVVPIRHLDLFRAWLSKTPEFASTFLNYGEQLNVGDPAPFGALHVRIKPKIVAEETNLTDGLDMTHPDYLTPEQWNEAMSKPDSLVIDCRNHYESDIGRFDGAKALRADKFDPMFTEIMDQLKGRSKDQEVLIYCTGGIRCEKIGAYLRQKEGYSNIKQLRGGIVNYARTLRNNPEFQSKYLGLQFNFDQRIVQDIPQSKITEHQLTHCQQCGAAASATDSTSSSSPSMSLVNCANQICDTLFVQCTSCRTKFEGCCCHDCAAIVEMESTARQADQTKDQVDGSNEPKHQHHRVSLDQAILLRRSLGTLRNEVYQGSHQADNKRRDATGRPVPFLMPLLARHFEQRPNTMLLPVATEEYCTKISSQPQPAHLLDDAERKLNALNDPKASRMSTGPWQGSLLSFLIKLHRPKFALELGTLYGYSTMCIAHAMGRGHLITVDSSIKSTNQASQTFKQFELHYPQSTKITAQCSKAADFLQTYADKLRSKDANTPQFDFIYIDADKANYSQYFDLIIDNKLLAENGFMLIDNCLWKGEVVSATTGALTPAQTSKQAKTLMRFNEKVSADVRVEKVMLPLRDGLFMLRWA